MIAQIGGVRRGTIDQTRLATPEEWNAQEIHPRGFRDASIVPDAALSIEHRHVQPGVVGTEARSPDDGSNLPAAKIDPQGRRAFDPGRLESVRWRGLAVQSA